MDDKSIRTTTVTIEKDQLYKIFTNGYRKMANLIKKHAIDPDQDINMLSDEEKKEIKKVICESGEILDEMHKCILSKHYEKMKDAEEQPEETEEKPKKRDSFFD